MHLSSLLNNNKIISLFSRLCLWDFVVPQTCFKFIFGLSFVAKETSSDHRKKCYTLPLIDCLKYMYNAADYVNQLHLFLNLYILQNYVAFTSIYAMYIMYILSKNEMYRFMSDIPTTFWPLFIFTCIELYLSNIKIQIELNLILNAHIFPAHIKGGWKWRCVQTEIFRKCTRIITTLDR